MDPTQPRPQAASRVEMTQIVLPSHTNALGSAFGGTVMAWMDVAGAISAQRHCRRQVVTASVDQLHFVEPIRLGMVVVLKAQVNQVFHTSMEVGVRVDSEDPATGERRHALTAYLTFVALGPDGKPRPVPPVQPVDAVDQRRAEQAVVRRNERLRWRQARKDADAGG